MTAWAQPSEGISAEGFYRLESPADLAQIDLAISGTADSPESAEAELENHATEVFALLRSSGLVADSLREADRAVTSDPGAREWRAVRDVRGSVRRTSLPAVLGQLRDRVFVTIGSITPASSQRLAAQTAALERATAEARRKAETAARELGFALGPVREIRVSDAEDRPAADPSASAMIGVEARVFVRYGLVPATAQTEVMAIAAAKEKRRAAESSASATAVVEQRPASRSSADDASTALAVEIVAATYDSSGRGRFTTAAGTIWRETVPTPVQQRLKSGRVYRGAITPGIFGGYRMELVGIPRVLKVEPATDRRP